MDIANCKLQIANWHYASWLLQLAISVCIFPTTAGCRQGEDARTTVDFWAIGTEGEQVQHLIRDFERENPSIRVRLQQIPWSAAHERLVTAFAGDATPDVCQLGNTWIPEFVALGALEPLDEGVAQSDVVQPADYFPGLWETNRVDGRVYGIPWYADTRVMFYRRDTLAAAGYDEPPKTWSQWLDAMRRIKQLKGEERYSIIAAPSAQQPAAILNVNVESYAILIPTNEWEQPTIFALQTGSQLLRDGGRYGNFRSAEFRKSFEFYIRLFAEGLTPIKANTQISNVWEEFARGYFAMYITGPWNIGEFRRRLPAHVQEHWAVAPLPRPDDSPHSISQAGGCGLVMFRRSEAKDAAWQLIEFLSRPESQVRFYELTGNLPPRESSWQAGNLENDPHVAAFHEQLEHVAPLPRVPEWEQITTKIMEAGQAVVHGRKAVDRALADLDRDVDQLLDKRRWMLARGTIR